VNHYPFDFLNVIVLIFFLAFYLYWAISASGVKTDVPGKGSRIGRRMPRAKV
jgi:hypothetical protein